MFVSNKLQLSKSLCRCSSSVKTVPTVNDKINKIQPFVHNRNPRNLERLRLARKPVGYGFDLQNVEYWHKLQVEQANRYVSATLIHNNENIVVSATTREWSLRKFLYSATDTSAYILLAQVFAERCLETGINSFFNELEAPEGSKVDIFLKKLQEEGLSLQEATHYDPTLIWHKKPERKPWLVHED